MKCQIFSLFPLNLPLWQRKNITVSTERAQSVNLHQHVQLFGQLRPQNIVLKIFFFKIWNRSGTGSEPVRNRFRTEPEPNRNRAIFWTGTEPEPNRTRTEPEPAGLVDLEPNRNRTRTQGSEPVRTGSNPWEPWSSYCFADSKGFTGQIATICGQHLRIGKSTRMSV